MYISIYNQIAKDQSIGGSPRLHGVPPSPGSIFQPPGPIFPPLHFHQRKKHWFGMIVSPFKLANGTKSMTNMRSNSFREICVWKSGFYNPSYTKTLFYDPQTSRFRLKNHYKKRPGNKHEKKPHLFVQSARKTFRMEIRNPPRIMKSLCLDPKVSFLVLLGAPGSSHASPGQLSRGSRHDI